MFKATLKLGRHLVLFIAAFGAGVAMGNPTGGQVANGNANISQSGNTTTVQQSSQRAIINWQSFNIAAGEKTQFQQPKGGIALNRINPMNGASQIYGALNATGTIILVNGAGIHFGPGSMVNVGGLIASTGDISDRNFLHNKFVFDHASKYSGSIVNEGTIKTADYGLVALLGTGVVNNGYIQAEMGSIALGSGDKFTLDFNGDQLINFTVNEETKKAGKDQNGNTLTTGVLNNGKMLADGGKILVTARAAAGVLDNAIDMRGVAQAHSVRRSGGVIILSAGSGNVRVSGRLSTSGRRHRAKGGTIEVLGQNIYLASTANLDASGYGGGGNIYIGGNEHGKGPLPNALTTTVDSGAVLNASAIHSGNGGNVIVWSNNLTNFAGTILAKGGALSGNGGFSEVSGHEVLNFHGGIVNLTAANGAMGTLLLDPENVTIQTAGVSSVPVISGTYTPITDDSILTVLDLQTALLLSNVNVTTGSTGSQAGNITVNDSVSWSSGNMLTLTAANNIYLNADITATNGGSLSLSAGSQSNLITSGTEGSPSATGVTANINVDNFYLIQGSWIQNNSSLPQFNIANDFEIDSGNLPSSNASFTRVAGGDGSLGSPYLINDVYGLEGVGSSATNLSQNYLLNDFIDASSTANWNSGKGFIAIGTASTDYSGTFDGQDFTITSLTGTGGLFNTIDTNGIVQNLGLISPNFVDNNSGDDNTGTLGAIASTNNGAINTVWVSNGTVSSYQRYVGGLVGTNNGSITTSYNSATTVTGLGSSGAEGGLVGISNSGSSITSSYNDSTLGSTTTGYDVGGVTGQNSGAITASWNLGNITGGSGNTGGLVGQNAGSGFGGIFSSYNTGNIIGGGNVGGLVGSNNGNIHQSYNTGTVSGSGTASLNVGGLIGYVTGGTIDQSYNTGDVTLDSLGMSVGGNNVGGFVGYMFFSGFINNSYTVGTVTTDDPSNYIGGFAGDVYSAFISHSYSAETVNAINGSGSGGFAGGFIGRVFQTAYPTFDYYDNTLAPIAAIGSGPINNGDTATGLSTAQMKNFANFSGFDFTSSTPNWGFTQNTSINNGYAVLVNTQPGGVQYSFSLQGTVAGASSGDVVNIYQNGTLLNAATTDSSGFFSYAASGLAGSGELLFELVTAGLYSNGVTLIPSAANGGLNINLALNSLTIGDTTFNNTISAANLGSALIGVPASSSILYSVSGNNLTLQNTSGSPSTVNLVTAANTTFQTGDISYGANTSGNMTFNAPVQVLQNATLTTAGNIVFATNATIDDANSSGTDSLTLQSANLTLTADVGDNSSLSDLTIQDASGGSTGAMTLVSDLAINTTNSITVDSAINSNPAHDWGLTLQTNTIELGGNIGGSGALSFLTANGATSVTVNAASVTTFGVQNYNYDSVHQAALGGNLTFNNATSTSLSTTDASSGNINFGSNVNFNAPTTTVAAAGGVLYNGNIEGATALTSTGTHFGNTIIVLNSSGEIGSSGTPLTSLTFAAGGPSPVIGDGDGIAFMNPSSSSLTINTVGNQTFNNGLSIALEGSTINNEVNLNGANINLNNHIKSEGGTVTINSNASGSTNLSGGITSSGGGSTNLNVNTLVVTANAFTDSGSNITLENSADFTVNSGATLSMDGQFNNASINKNGTGSLMFYNSQTSLTNLNVNAGFVGFETTDVFSNGGTVTVASGAALSIDNAIQTSSLQINLNGTGISGSGALIGTGTAELDGSTITLQSDATISTPGSSDIFTLGSDTSIDGSAGTENLALIGAGTMLINGSMGSNAGLGSLTSSVANLNLGSSSINTSGDQNYNSSIVTLNDNNNSGVFSFNSTGGNINFNNSSLVFAVSNGSPLLTVNGNLNLAASTISAEGPQNVDVTGNIIIGTGNSVITNLSGGSTLEFNGTIDADSSQLGNLEFSGDSAIQLDSDVGLQKALHSITEDSTANLTIGNGNGGTLSISTVNDQDYMGGIYIHTNGNSQNLNLTSSSGSITLDSGNFITSDNAFFLNSIIFNGTTNFNTDDSGLSGDIIFELASGTTANLNSSGAFGNGNLIIDGGATLILNTDINSSMNEINGGGTIVVPNNASVNINGVVQDGGISFNGTYQVGTNSTLNIPVEVGSGFTKTGTGTMNLSGSDIIIFNDLDIQNGTLGLSGGSLGGGVNLIIESAATLTLADSVNPSVNLVLNGGSVTTTGSNTLTGTLTVTNGTNTITTSNSGDSFEVTGTVDSDGSNSGSLTTAGPGAFQFDSDIGASNPLATFTANSTNGATFEGNVSTTGNQNYHGTITFNTLGSTTTVYSSSGTTTFANDSILNLSSPTLVLLGNVNLSSGTLGNSTNSTVNLGDGTIATNVTLNTVNGFFTGSNLNVEVKNNATFSLNADYTTAYNAFNLDSGATLQTTGTRIFAGGGLFLSNGGTIDGTGNLDLQDEPFNLDLTKTGTGTLTIHSALGGTQNVNGGRLILDGGAGTNYSGGNFVVNSGGTLELNNITVGTNISLNGGTLSASGISELQNVVNLSGGTSILLLPTSSDTIQFDQGIVAHSASNAGLTINASASGVSLPFIDLLDGGTGNLTVNAVGAITQADVLAVGGTSSFNAGAGAITLNNINQSNVNGTYTGNSLLGTVNVSNSGANDINIINNASLTIGTVTAGRNVTFTTSSGSAGDITVSSAISLTTANILNLNADGNIFLNANFTGGHGGLVLNAANNNLITSGSEGSLSATGVTANISVNNFNLAAGLWTQVNSTLPTFTVANDFELNSGNGESSSVQFIRALSGDGASSSTPYLLTDIYGVQGINSNSQTLQDFYKLNGDVTASVTTHWNSGTGFYAIGGNTNDFSGDFNGNGHVISSLFINSTANNVGLFAIVDTTATIENLGMVTPNISGANNAGALAGTNNGTLNTVYVSGGSVDGGSGSGAVGGLVGENGSDGIISIADNNGTDVTVGNGGLLGGLAGFNSGTIANTYNSGSVTISDNSGGSAGGLVGYNRGSISTSYNVGLVTDAGTNDIGALVGDDHSGTYLNNYYDSTTSGASNGTSGGDIANITALNDTQMQVYTNFVGFNFTSGSPATWAFLQSGYAYPVLTAITAGPYKTTASGITITGQVIGGNTDSISFFLDGLSLGSVTTDASGNYSFNSTLATGGGDLLAYITTNGFLGSALTLASSANATISGLNFKLNTLDVGDSGTNSINNTNLANGLSSLSSALTLFTASGNNITLNSGISLFSTATTTYTLNGNISGSGNIQFSGPVNLSHDATVSTTSGTISLNSIDGANQLTLTSSGGTTIAGVVGGTTPLDTITINGAATLDNDVTTDEGQVYQGNVTLGGNITVTSSGGSPLVFVSNIIGGGHQLSLISAGNSTLAGTTATGSATISNLSELILTGGQFTVFGNNTTFGGTTLIHGGAVIMNTPTALGNSASNTITVDSAAGPGIIELPTGTTTVANNFSLTGAVGSPVSIITGGNTTLTGNIAMAGADLDLYSATGATFTLSGNISGSVGILFNYNLVPNVNGTITLSGANTFTGNITVENGILNLASAGAIGDGTHNANSIEIFSGAELDLGLNNSVYLSSTPIQLDGGTGVSTNGALYDTQTTHGTTYNGSITQTAASTIGVASGSGNTLLLGGNINLGNSTMTLATQGLSRLSLGGVISSTGSSGGITLNGGQDSVAVITNSNTYTGATVIQSGIYDLGSTAALGATSSILVDNGGTLYFQAAGTYNPASVTNITVNGAGSSDASLAGVLMNELNPVVLGSNYHILLGSTSTFGVNAASFTINGPINIAPANTNPTNLTFSYVSGIGVSLGNIDLTGNSNVGNLTVVTSNGSTFGAITQQAATSLNISGTSSFTAGAAGITLQNSGDVFAGAISASNSGSNDINITAAGALSLGTISGGRAINLQSTGSSITIGSPISLISNNTLALTASSNILLNSNINSGFGSLQFTATSVNLGGNETLSANSITLTGNVNGNSHTLSFSNADANSAITGVISNLSGLTVNGTGTLTLSGNNTYSGITTVSSGTLRAGNATSAFGTGALDLNGGNLASSLTGVNTATLANSNIVIGVGASVGITGSGNLTFNVPISFGSSGNDTTGSLTINNTGTVTLNGLVESVATTSYLLSVNNSGTVIFNGGSTNNYNGFAGSMALQGGSTTEINNSAANQNLLGTGHLLLSNTTLSALLAPGASSVVANTLDDPTANLTIGGSQNITFTGNSSIIQQVWAINNTATTTFSGNLNLLNQFNVNNGTLVLSGSNTCTSCGSTDIFGINIASGASVNLTNANALGTATNYMGPIVVSSGGELDISNISLAALSVITLNGTGLASNSGHGALYETSASGSGAIGSAISLASNTSVGEASGGSLSLSGVISGTTFSLTQAGAGTLNLSGANIYTGATNVNGGTLSLQNVGALGTGVSTESTSISVGGSGTIDFNFGTNGTLTNTTSISMASGSVLTFSGSHNNTVNNALSLAGASTIGGANTGTSNTLGGVISGASGSLAMTGSDFILISNGSNTFGTGGTTGFTLNGGTISVGNNSSLGVGNLVLTSGIIQANSANNLTLSQAYSLNGSATIGGTNTFILSNTGTLTSGTLTITNTNNANLTGTLTGAGALTINSVSGTSSIGSASSANSGYSGIITLTSGALNIVSDAHIDPLGTGTLNLNGGILEAGTAIVTNPLVNPYTVGGNVSISGSGGSITLNNTGTLTSGALTVSTSGSAVVTLSGNLTGSAGIIVNTANTAGMVLSGANTNTSAITVTNGFLSLNSAGAIGNGTSNAASILVSSGGELDLGAFAFNSTTGITLNGTGFTHGAALYVASTGGGSFNGNLSLGSAATIGEVASGTFSLGGTVNNGASTVTYNAASGATLTEAGAFINSGSGGLTNSSSGKIILSGANTYTGTTNDNSGTLSIQNIGGLGTGTGSQSTAINIANGATLDFAFGSNGTLTNTTSMSMASGSSITFSGANNNVVNNALALAGTFTISGSGTGTGNTLGGIISGASGALTKSGTDLIILNNANTFGTAAVTGVTLNGGTLSVGNNSALGVGKLVMSSGTLVATSANSLTLANPFTVSGSSTIGGANNITFTNNGSISAALTVNDSATAAISGIVSGAGTVTVSGTGTLTLSGANTFTGGYNVSSGFLSMQSADALGTGTGHNAAGVTTSVTGELDLGNFIFTSTTALSIGGTGTNAALYANTAGTTTYNGAIVLSGANTTMGAIAGNTFNLGGGINNNGTQLQFNGAGNITVTGNIIGGGSTQQAGTGTLTLSGTNTYNGGTLFLAGIIDATNNSALGTNNLVMRGGTLVTNNSSNNTVTFTDNLFIDTGTGATTSIIGGNNNTIFSGTVSFTSGDTVNITNSGTTTFNGTINGAGSFTSSGTAGNIILGTSATVGSTTALTSVNIGNTITINSSAIKTTGAQTYSGAITLGNTATTITSTGNGAMSFNTINGSTVNADSLTLSDGTGVITFNGAIGGGVNGALNNLTTTSGNTGGLTLPAITLAGNLSVTTSAGSIFQNNAITSSGNVSLIANGSGTNGDVTVGNTIGWGASSTLTLTAANHIYLNNAISGSSLALSAANTTVTGSATADITSGTEASPNTNGVNVGVTVTNFNLAAGGWYQDTSSLPTFTNTNFQLASGGLNPAATTQFIRANGGSGSTGSPYQLTDIYGLQGVATLPASSFIMNSSITATATSSWTNTTGTGFVPIGASTVYTGTFNGNGFSINNLTLSAGNSAFGSGNFGLFDSVTGTIKNLGLANETITGTATSNLGIVQIGGLVGLLNSGASLSNDWMTGSITYNLGATTSIVRLGGLVGNENGGLIANSFFAGNVTVTGSGTGGAILGGLVGSTGNTSGVAIQQSYFSGNLISTLTNSPAFNSAGGLTGEIRAGTAQIKDSYATGTLTANSSSSNNQVGGFVGSTPSGTSITTSYSSVYVLGAAAATTGGFAGKVLGTLSGDFYDTSYSGQANGVGGASSTTGLTPGTLNGSSGANLSSLATYSAFNIAANATSSTGTIWGILPGTSYPYLTSFYSVAPITISGTTTGLAAGTTVNLADGGVAVSGAGFTGITFVGATTGSGATASGSYYFLIPGNTIATNDSLLIYGGTGTNLANDVSLGSSTGFNNANLTIGTLQIGNSATSTISNTNLATAAGSLGSSKALYSVDGSNNLTLGSVGDASINLIASATTNYNANGNILITSGGTDVISILGNATFGGNVGASAGRFSSVSVAGTTTVSGNNASVFTSGNQTYTGAMTLNAGITGFTLDTGSGTSNTIGLAAITGNANNLTLNTLGTATMNGAFTSSGNFTFASAGSLIVNNVASNPFGTGILGFTNGGILSATTAATSLGNSNITTGGALAINGANSISMTGALALGANLTLGNTGTSIITLGNISGIGFGITDNGAAATKLILQGSDTFTGALSVSTGIISAQNANALGDGTNNPSITVSGTGELDLGNFNFASTSAISLTGSGTTDALYASTAGTTTFAGIITLAGNTNIGAISGNTFNLTGASITNGANNLIFNGAGNINVSNVIGSGAGTVTQSGSGTLTLSGQNTYTGSTTLTSGILSAGNATNSFGSGAGALNLNGGQLTSALTATITNNYNVGASNTVTIGGSNALTLSGAGTLNASSTLNVSDTNATSGATFSGGLTGAGSLSITSGDIATISGTNTLATPISVSGTLNVTGTNTLSGSVSGGGTISVSGAATFSNSNPFNGSMNLTAGSLIAGNATNAFGVGSLNLSGGIVSATVGATLGNSSTSVTSAAAIGGSSNITITNGIAVATGVALTIGDSATTTLNGLVSGGGSLILNSGTTTLAHANSYTGGTTLNNSAIMTLNSVTAAGTGLITSNNTSEITLGVTGTYANDITLNDTTSAVNNIFESTNLLNPILSGALTINGNTIIRTNGFNSSLELTGQMSGAGTINAPGGNTFIFGGTNNTFTGTINATGSGTLQAASNNAFGAAGATLNANGSPISYLGFNEAANINFNNATGQAFAGTNYTLSGNFVVNTGFLSINLAAGNMLNITGTLSGNHGITINGATGSTVEFSGTDNSGYNQSVTLSSGTLQLGSTNATGSGSLILSGGSLQAATGVTVNNSSFSVTGNAGIGGSNNITFANGGSISNGDILSISNSGVTTFSSAITGAGGLAESAGTVILTGSNSYSGATTLSGGILAASSGGASLSGNLNVTGNASIGGANNITINTVSLSSGKTLSLSNTGTTVFNGAVSGAGSLAQSAGTVELSASNSYGNTTLTGGTLEINNASNALGTGTLNLNGGALTSLLNATLANVVSVATDFTIGGSNNLTFSNAMSLTSGVTLSITNSGTTTFAGISGAASINDTNSAGSVVFNAALGSGTALNSINMAGATTLNGGAVNTTGNQTYSNLVTLGANTTLNSNSNISLTGGVSGAGKNLTITGGSGSNAITVGGALALNNITVTGGSGNNSSLAVQSSNAQTWTIGSSNAGTITGTGVTGSFIFSNIENLTGGNNGNIFQLNGGNLTGAITGGSGNNTLVADNVADTWNISGSNRGSVNGVAGFNNIQNLTGGNVSNDFVFANNAGVSGMVTGNGSNNTLDYSAYIAPVTVTLSADGVGFTTNSQSAVITNFTNIQNLTSSGNAALFTSANKTNTIILDGPTSGIVNDPVNFTGFNLFGNSGPGSAVVTFAPGDTVIFTGTNTATVNGVPVTFINIQSFNGQSIPFTPPPPSNINSTENFNDFNNAEVTGNNLPNIINSPTINNQYGMLEPIAAIDLFTDNNLTDIMSHLMLQDNQILKVHSISKHGGRMVRFTIRLTDSLR